MVRQHELEFRVQDLKNDIRKCPYFNSKSDNHRKALFRMIDKNILLIKN